MVVGTDGAGPLNVGSPEAKELTTTGILTSSTKAGYTAIPLPCPSHLLLTLRFQSYYQSPATSQDGSFNGHVNQLNSP